MSNKSTEAAVSPGENMIIHTYYPLMLVANSSKAGASVKPVQGSLKVRL